MPRAQFAIRHRSGPAAPATPTAAQQPAQPPPSPAPPPPDESVDPVERCYADLLHEYEAAIAACPIPAPVRQRHKWMTVKVWNAVTAKGEAYRRMQQASKGADRDKATLAYKKARNVCSRETKLRQNEWYDEKAARIQTAAERRDFREVYEETRALFKPVKPSMPVAEARHASCVTHFANLFAPPTEQQQQAQRNLPALARPPPVAPRTRLTGELRAVLHVAIDGQVHNAGAVDNSCVAGFGVHFPEREAADLAGRVWGPQYPVARGQICALLMALRATSASPEQRAATAGAAAFAATDRTDRDPAEHEEAHLDVPRQNYLPPPVAPDFTRRLEDARVAVAAAARLAGARTPPDLHLLGISAVTRSNLEKLDKHIEANFADVDNADLWREIARSVIEEERIVTYEPQRTAAHQGAARATAVARQLAGRGIMGSDAAPPPIAISDTPVKHIAMRDDVPTDDEIRSAIAQLHDTAPGLDKIRARDLKSYESVTSAVIKLVKECWAAGTVPRAFVKAVIAVLPKKPGAREWTDHRGITLLSVPGKVLARIILDRARGVDVLQEQHGFRRANGTAAATLVTKRVVEEAKRTGLPLVVTFLDLTKAYDSIPRDLLWETMHLYGFGKNAIGLIKALYDDEVVVKLGGKLSTSSFKTFRGVRQGCLLSPFLFNLVMDRVLRTALPHVRGVPFKHHETGEVRAIKGRGYADDIATFSRHMVDAQHDLNAMVDACGAAGLQLNAKKTEYLRLTDRRNLEAAQRQPPTVLPRSIKTVPRRYTNAGARWYKVDDLKDDHDCPFRGCPARGAQALKGDVCLRKHFDHTHTLSVSVCTADPVDAEEVAVTTVTRPNGEVAYGCPHCEKTYSTRVVAAAHYRDMVKNGKAESLGIFLQGGNKQRLASAPTVGGTAKATLRDLDLDFDKDNDDNAALLLGSHTVKRVQQFQYLGRIITDNNSDDKAVAARLKSLRALSTLWTSGFFARRG